MIDRILVPLDGSRLAEASLPYARAVARSFPARLLLLRVIVPGAGRTEERSHVAWRSARAEAESYLEEVADGFREDGVQVEFRVSSGSPSEEILEVARSWKAEMIVLSSHGRGGWISVGLGGTAHKVTSAASTSVLLVRIPEGSAEPADFTGLKRILVPVDGSPRAEWAVCLASSVARANGAELLIVHVVLRPELLSTAPDADGSKVDAIVEENRREAERQLAAIKRQLESPELPVRTVVDVAPNAARAIVEIAAREDASLVVCAAHGRSAHAQWPYGTVSGSLLSHGDTPILVFQDFPHRNDRDAPPVRESGRATRPRATWPA